MNALRYRHVEVQFNSGEWSVFCWSHYADGPYRAGQSYGPFETEANAIALAVDLVHEGHGSAEGWWIPTFRTTHGPTRRIPGTTQMLDRMHRQNRLTLSEAALWIGVQPDTLRQQIHNGSLTAVKVGRDWFVAWDECLRYARERGAKPVGRPASR